MPARRSSRTSAAKERLAQLKDPHTAAARRDGRQEGRTITLGGTTLELTYVGLNHSDSTLVMRLPKEKIIFVGRPPSRSDAMPGRGMIDFHPIEAEEFDQEDPRDGLGADDSRPSRTPAAASAPRRTPQEQLALLAGRLGRDEEAGAGRQVLGYGGEGVQAAEVREAGPAMQTGLPFVARRYCGLWGRGT